MNMKKKALSLFLAICLITLTAFQTSAQPGVTSYSFLDGEDQELQATPGTTATPGTSGDEEDPEPEPPGRQPRALATNKSLSAVATGDTVKINVGGTPYEFIVVHHGKPSDMYDDSFNNGVWLLMKDVYEIRQWHTANTNSYEWSSIHSHLNSTFIDLIDADIRNQIKQVKIPHAGNGSSPPVHTGANGLLTKAFLLSGQEVGFPITYPCPYDGAKLDYFDYGETEEAKDKRAASLSGSEVSYWLRSPLPGTPGGAWYCGYFSGTGYRNDTYGFRPAFILPNTLYIGSDGFVVIDSPPTDPPSISVPSSILYNSAYTVSWGASTSGSNTLGGYVLERQINGGAWTQIYQGSATSFSQTLTRNQANTVNYRVKAYSTGGLESGYTTGPARTVTNNREPTAPTGMTNVSAVNSWQSASIAFSWSASTDADGDTINYVVETSINGGAWTVAQNNTSRSYTHTISIPGHTYMQARVRSYDGTVYSGTYLTSGVVNITHDTTDPTIQLTAVPDATTTWAKDSVIITAILSDDRSGLKSLTVPAGVSPAGNQTLSGMNATKQFTVTANNTYSFTVTDNAGRSKAASITLTKIDANNPVIAYTTTPPDGEFTNGDVTVNLNISDASSGLASFNSLNGSESVSGLNISRTYTAVANGIYPFSATDIVGHTTAINVNVNMIDRVKPVAYIVPRVKQWTKAASVVLDVTGTDDYSGVASLMLPDATTIESAAGTYEIFNNGEYMAMSTDRANNISDVIILDYQWFDRTKPTVQFVKFVDTANPVINFLSNLFGQTVSNKHVKIEVTADDTPESGEGESGVTHVFYRVFDQAGELVQDWTSSPIGTAPVIDYDVNGSIEIYVKDAADNESDTEAHDIIIDTKAPEVEITYSTTEITNDPVEVTLKIMADEGSPAKGWILPEGGVLAPGSEITYAFSENAIKTFVAYDTAGNKREVEIRITNIEALKVPVELWENNQVVIDAVMHAVSKRYIEDVTYNDLLKITFIDMSSNFMDSIPDVFGEAANLEHLDLRGNEFKEIPECVYKLEKLKYLDLSNNNLISIGGEIRNLTRLDTFDVSLNYLEDYDCPLIVPNYKDAGNFTNSNKDNQYHFNFAEPQDSTNQTGNTVQINVNWFYDGEPIDRLEDHRKVLYMGLYPQYRTYRPLLYRYEARYGQVNTATPDYAQVLLRSKDVEMELNLKLGA